MCTMLSEDFECPEETHKCRNAECVAPELVCNRKVDCVDWSDEHGCRKSLLVE